MGTWIRVDANLDHHPKAKRAGRWGKTVAQLVWRLIKCHGRDGIISASYVTGENLADEDGASEAGDPTPEMYSSGLQRAIGAEFFRRLKDGSIEAVDWDDYQWDRTATERQQRCRDQRKRNATSRSVTDVTRESRDVTAVTAVTDVTGTPTPTPTPTPQDRGARARVGSSTRLARIAKWHADAMRTVRGSKAILEDLAGAAVCEPILAPLSDEDCEAVVRAFVADNDPWLADPKMCWGLRWLDAGRANRYLTPASKSFSGDYPSRHVTWEPATNPDGPPPGWDRP